MSYPQPEWGPGQRPPPPRSGAKSGGAVAWAVAALVFIAIAGTSLALTIVMVLIAFAFAAVATVAKLGKVKLPIASVRASHIVVPTIVGVLALWFGVDMETRRRVPPTNATVAAQPVLPTQQADVAQGNIAAPELPVPDAAVIRSETPRTQPELHRRVREASRLGRYREALDAFSQLNDTFKARSLGDGARCVDAVSSGRLSSHEWAEFGRRRADSLVDWNVRLTHWGRYRQQPHEFELRCEPNGQAIVATTHFSFQSGDSAVRVVGRLHVRPAMQPALEIFYVLNGLHEVVGGPPLDGVMQ